jgi:hypothetical protein
MPHDDVHTDDTRSRPEMVLRIRDAEFPAYVLEGALGDNGRSRMKP